MFFFLIYYIQKKHPDPHQRHNKNMKTSTRIQKSVRETNPQNKSHKKIQSH